MAPLEWGHLRSLGVTVSPSVVEMGQDAPESSTKLVKVFASPLCSDPEVLATGCHVWSSSIREGWSLCWVGVRAGLHPLSNPFQHAFIFNDHQDPFLLPTLQGLLSCHYQ